MHGFLYWSAYNNICETLHMDAAPGRLMNGDATACGNALAKASRDARATPELFLSAARQFLATADARTCRVECRDPAWTEYGLGFETKRIGDHLYVTHADQETRLAPGMRIVAVGRNTVPHLLNDIAQEIFGGRGTDRENWDLALRMYRDIDVFPGDGHVKRIELARFPHTDERAAGGQKPCADVCEATHGVARVAVRALDDPEGLRRALQDAREVLERCDAMVLDLRSCTGEADCACYLELFPYLVGTPMPARDLMGDVQLYTIYSRNNAARLLETLAQARATFARHGDEAHVRLVQEAMADVREKTERVLASKRTEAFTLAERRTASEVSETAPSPFADETVVPASQAPRRVAVLLDTATGVGAERLAEAVRGKEGVALVGRATPGAIDYANYVTVDYPDILASFTYPISRTAANRDGKGYARRGLPLDVHVPFTAEECTRDVMLERAIEVVRG